MIKRREDFRFSLESRHALRVAGEGFRQDFYCDIAAELGIPRTVHFSHSTRTDSSENFVGPDASAGGHCHLGGDYTPRDITA